MADRVAHETRNPIVIIGGFSRRIRRNLPDDDSMVRYIDIIIKEVERLEKMIFWITEYKKYISAEFEEANIHKILEHAISALAEKMKDRNVTIERNLLRDPPHVRVDKRNMEFVFLNLFENGIETMDNQGVLHVTTRLKGDTLLEVIISTTGKGIAADDLKSIYYPFFASTISGAGMGLTITHKIIKDHNGSLKVKSKPGEGATFTVELPIISETDYPAADSL
jgi:signal transduction histidine kinase